MVPVNENGEFSIDFGQDLKYAPGMIAGAYYQDGYNPQTIRLLVKDGKILNSSVVVQGVPLNDTSVVIDTQYEKPYQLFHLGDDSFNGLANSQLQKPAEGLRKHFRLKAVTSAQLYNYPSGICVTLDARGIQDTNSTITFEGESSILLSSPIDGTFGSQMHCFKTKPSTHVSGSSLIIQSMNSGTDYDDFEIINVRVAFSTLLPTPPIGIVEKSINSTTEGGKATFNLKNIATHAQSSVKRYIWDFNDGSLPLITTIPTATHDFGSDWAFHQVRITLKDETDQVLGTVADYLQVNSQPNKIAGFSINAAVNNNNLVLIVGLGTPESCDSYSAPTVFIALPNELTVSRENVYTSCEGVNTRYYINKQLAAGGIIKIIAKASQMSGTIPAAVGQPSSSCYEYAKNYCKIYPGW